MQQSTIGRDVCNQRLEKKIAAVPGRSDFFFGVALYPSGKCGAVFVLVEIVEKL